MHTILNMIIMFYLLARTRARARALSLSLSLSLLPQYVDRDT